MSYVVRFTVTTNKTQLSDVSLDLLGIIPQKCCFQVHFRPKENYEQTHDTANYYTAEKKKDE